MSKAEDRADDWGLVSSDGSINVARLARLIAYSGLLTVVSALVSNMLAFRDAMVNYHEYASGWLTHLVTTYTSIPINVIGAASRETRAWFDLFGPAAFPIAALSVFVALWLVTWGVSRYV